MMRFAPVFAVLCLAGPASSQAPSRADAGDRLRVGTWNIEFFGDRKEPRTAADVAKIAALIEELRIDVLALQEICGPEPLRQLTDALGPGYRFVLGSTGKFQDGTGRLSVGFLWNDARAEMVQAEELLDLPTKVDGGAEFGELDIFHRAPVSAVFRARHGGLDFRAVTVHLKAQLGRKNDAKRAAEVAQLGRKLASLLVGTEDRDVVVLGDFNHDARDGARDVFVQACGIQYLAPVNPGPSILWFEQPIDHIGILGTFAEEVVADSVRVHNGGLAQREAWQRTYSDHFPVTVDLDATRDRDPGGTFAPVKAEFELRAGGFAAADARPAGAAPSPAAHETAQRRAAADASAARPALEEVRHPFLPGKAVTVHLLSPGNGVPIYNGTLLQIPSDWVYLRTEDGKAIAFPRVNVAALFLR
jgi:endonuclease/exonuclease/phosphatase family metal-dependent hydrolase